MFAHYLCSIYREAYLPLRTPFNLKGIDIDISRSRYKEAIENAYAFIVSLAPQ